jgi:hypothetical protein
MKQPGMVAIVRVMSRAEAEIVSSLLDAADIPNVIDADDAGGTNPELDLTRAIDVLVGEGEATRARQVLVDARAAGHDLPDVIELE